MVVHQWFRYGSRCTAFSNLPHCVSAVALFVMEHVVAELDGVADYIANQRSIGMPEDSVTACREGIVRTVSLLVTGIPRLSTAEASRLLHKLNGSVFTDAEQKQLGDIIVAKSSTPVIPANGAYYAKAKI